MDYFYVLRTNKDSKYYYGSTNNLRKRYQQHKSGKVKATAHRLPLELVYYEAYRSLFLARARERQVKSSGSARRVILERITHKSG